MTHTISSAEFLKSYGSIVQTALREPVSITSHGRAHLVLLSAEEYRRLKQQDRAALYTPEMNDAALSALGVAEPQGSDFDHEGIAPDALMIVKRAAELQGRSVDDFVAAAAQEAASRAVEAAQMIRLSVEDQRAFADAVLNPPPPSEALERAAQAHQRLVGTPK